MLFQIVLLKYVYKSNPIFLKTYFCNLLMLCHVIEVISLMNARNEHLLVEITLMRSRYTSALLFLCVFAQACYSTARMAGKFGLPNDSLSASAWTPASSDLTNTTNGGYEFSETSKLILTIVISIVSVLGIVGNTVVILIVLLFSDMHTLINFSFANLALTDLTLLLLDGVPTATDTIGWNLSAKLGCNVPIYLQYVSTKAKKNKQTNKQKNKKRINVLFCLFVMFQRF